MKSTENTIFLQLSTGIFLTGSHKPISESILTFLFYLSFHLVISKITFLLAMIKTHMTDKVLCCNL